MSSNSRYKLDIFPVGRVTVQFSSSSINLLEFTITFHHFVSFVPAQADCLPAVSRGRLSDVSPRRVSNRKITINRSLNTPEGSLHDDSWKNTRFYVNATRGAGLSHSGAGALRRRLLSPPRVYERSPVDPYKFSRKRALAERSRG